ncbi:MAG TPA: type II 3-dehydroquinate dehydratase [Gammaproteobacteria bacterium]|nr:type II 3-dehydroquinate dehydratase [Gammaproteobacteria bacterium]
MAKILVINGPNLNLLGAREPEHYGTETLDALMARATRIARAAGYELEAFQANAEHALVERVQRAIDEDIGFIVINPAAFTHTSIALRDALAAAAIPFIEVHLSNTHRRESFRRRSYFTDLAAGTIIGLGALGYELAVEAACRRLSDDQ